MFETIVQVGALWLGSSLVVGMIVGKALKASSQIIETKPVVVQPKTARIISMHQKAG